MSIEGQLKIDLCRRGAEIDRVEIISGRPARIAQLFVGKSVTETLDSIPLIFTICAMAQLSAGVAAFEMATGVAEFESSHRARQMIVMAESAREHLLRIALDWPQYIFGPIAAIDMKTVMGLPAAMRSALFASGNAFAVGAREQVDKPLLNSALSDFDEFLKNEIFGEDIAVWRSRTDFAALKDWAENTKTIPARLIRSIIMRGWEEAGRCDVSFLPPIGNKDILERLLRDDAGAFVSQPVWNGVPCETGALSRQIRKPLIKALASRYGTGLLTRLSARLCELAVLPADIISLLEGRISGEKSIQCGKGFGVSQIEAARGRLVHMVQVKGDVVENYRILAPTEWNFHASGPVAASLARLDASSDENLKMQAELLINAIDPCVGFEVRLC